VEAGDELVTFQEDSLAHQSHRDAKASALDSEFAKNPSLAKTFQESNKDAIQSGEFVKKTGQAQDLKKDGAEYEQAFDVGNEEPTHSYGATIGKPNHSLQPEMPVLGKEDPREKLMSFSAGS